MIPAFDPATLTDTQAVPDVPGGLEGHVPFFSIGWIIRGIWEHACQSGDTLFESGGGGHQS